MAADSSRSKRGDVEKTTHCQICNKLYTDPKLVPTCGHTFCRRCLEEYARGHAKKPGDRETCPLDGKVFVIPQGGMAKLRKDVDANKRVQTIRSEMSRKNVDDSRVVLGERSDRKVISGVVYEKKSAKEVDQHRVVQEGRSEKKNVVHVNEHEKKSHKKSNIGELHNERTNTQFPCDLCATGSEHDHAKFAKWYCVACGQKLCGQCFDVHKKLRATRSHQVVDLGDRETKHLVTSRPSFCDRHHDEQIRLYCFECKKVLCMVCHAVEHKIHKTGDVDEIAAELRKRLQKDNTRARDLHEKCRQEMEKIDREALILQEYVAGNEAAIATKTDDVVQLVRSHGNSLLKDLNDFKVKKINEAEEHREEIRRQRTMLENFTVYSQEVLEKATAADVCRVSEDVNVRSRDVQHVTVVGARPAARVTFLPTDVEDVLHDSRRNIVGAISATDSQQITGLYV